MEKKKTILLLAALFLSYIVTSYAINSISFVQNPTVPSAAFKVFQADGTTEIQPGSNQTAMWTWNPGSISFNTTIIIQNTSPTAFNATIAFTGLDVRWTPHGQGTYIVAADSTRPVQLSITNPNATAGQQVGTFTVTVAGA